jgi:hypothetical protein
LALSVKSIMYSDHFFVISPKRSEFIFIPLIVKNIDRDRLFASCNSNKQPWQLIFEIPKFEFVTRHGLKGRIFSVCVMPFAFSATPAVSSKCSCSRRGKVQNFHNHALAEPIFNSLSRAQRARRRRVSHYNFKPRFARC